MVTELLSELVGKNGHVAGIDFSAAQLGQARSRLNGDARIPALSRPARSIPACLASRTTSSIAAFCCCIYPSRNGCFAKCGATQAERHHRLRGW